MAKDRQGKTKVLTSESVFFWVHLWFSSLWVRLRAYQVNGQVDGKSGNSREEAENAKEGHIPTLLVFFALLCGKTWEEEFKEFSAHQ